MQQIKQEGRQASCFRLSGKHIKWCGRQWQQDTDTDTGYVMRWGVGKGRNFGISEEQAGRCSTKSRALQKYLLDCSKALAESERERESENRNHC